jgi:sugar phosphate isomerase/epimerase
VKLGVFDPILGNMALEPMLDKLQGWGLEAVEVACGGYVGDTHCKPAELLEDVGKLEAFRMAVESRGLVISALSCHGNPLHPDEAVAKGFHDAWRNTVLLAERLGVQTVVTFSGCPGGGPEDRTPNWITCYWPTDHARSLEWQWSERVIPYWREESSFAEAHGVRVAIEMHPGFCVYQPLQARRLREETRSNVGVNFDPSHLFWQGIDPVKAIRFLGDSIYHFHAKDTFLDPLNAPLKGVLDVDPYDQVGIRSWVFRSVGYGNPEAVWRNMVSALRTVGYDHVLSIEHEDALASRDEGLAKAMSVLRSAILREPPARAWWMD